MSASSRRRSESGPTRRERAVIIELRFDDQRPRRWMRHLIALLDSAATTRFRSPGCGPRPSRPAGLESLLDLERMLLRRGRPCGADADPALQTAAALTAAAAADIVLDFTAMPRDPSRAARLYLRPLYDGAAGEDAALAAIVAGDLPLIEIRDEISGAIVWTGTAVGRNGRRAGRRARHRDGAHRDAADRRARSGPRPVSPPRRSRRAAARVARRPMCCAASPTPLRERIYRLCCYSPHWRIGWRHTDDAGIWDSRRSLRPGLARRAEPRAIASTPIRFRSPGRAAPSCSSKNSIIASARAPSRRSNSATTDRSATAIPVLEEPWHLSYPFLIVHDDELWMIPESSGAARGDDLSMRRVPGSLGAPRHAAVGHRTRRRHDRAARRPALHVRRDPRRRRRLFGYAVDLPCRASVRAVAAARAAAGAGRSRQHAARPGISFTATADCGARCRTARTATAARSVSPRSPNCRRRISPRPCTTPSRRDRAGPAASCTR